MKILFKTIIVFLIIIYGCGQEQSRSKANQYDLVFYSKGKGEKPKIGDFVLFQMDILDDQKKLLQSYRNQKRMPSVKIPEKGTPGRTQNPIPEALSQMSVNDSAGIFIPKDSIPDLALEYDYISHLEYIIVLKEILSESEYQERLKEYKEEEEQALFSTRQRYPEVEKLAKETLDKFKNKDLAVKYTENGVGYYIHELGKGDMPTRDRLVSAQYYGLLQSNGIMFDNSFQKGRPFSFRLGRGGVIKGWDEAFMNFPAGTKASIFIPPSLGYGDAGAGPQIPPNSNLYFYVEIEEIYY